MVEFFNWLSKLDQTTASIIFMSMILLAFILVLMLLKLIKSIVHFFTSSSPKQKSGILKAILGIFGVKSDVDTKTLEVTKSTETSEVIILLTKVVKYKDNEKSLEKDYMTRSMNYVHTILDSSFSSIIKEMIYLSSPEFYNDNNDVLSLCTTAIVDIFADKFRDSVRGNHLHEYTDIHKKKSYIDMRVFDLVKSVSDPLSGVVKKLAASERKSFLEYVEGTEFARRITELFSSVLEYLITLAIEREALKASMQITLIDGIKTSYELSQSSLAIIKDILEID